MIVCTWGGCDGYSSFMIGEDDGENDYLIDFPFRTDEELSVQNVIYIQDYVKVIS
jgi:hypothetical protein